MVKQQRKKGNKEEKVISKKITVRALALGYSKMVAPCGIGFQGVGGIGIILVGEL